VAERKECPLRVLAGRTAKFAQCRGKDCAWWSETLEECAVLFLKFLFK